MARSRRGYEYIPYILCILALLLLVYLRVAWKRSIWPRSVQDGFWKNLEGFEDEPAVHMDERSPIKVFLYADTMKPTAKALTASLRKHKFSYEVLGLGKPWEGWIARTKTYLAAIQAYKAEKGPNAVALYIDAFDVICIMDSDRFYTKYLARERDMPVIFGAEHNCHTAMCNKMILDWYDYNEIDGGKAAVMAQMNTWGDNDEHLWSRDQPVFTNNGTIMGTAEGLEFLFTEILKTGIPDDQVAAGHVIAANLDRFDIDYEENLFRNRFRHLEKRPDENGVDGPGFLHFHAMKTDQQQADILERYKSYE